MKKAGGCHLACARQKMLPPTPPHPSDVSANTWNFMIFLNFGCTVGLLTWPALALAPRSGCRGTPASPLRTHTWEGECLPQASLWGEECLTQANLGWNDCPTQASGLAGCIVGRVPNKEKGALEAAHLCLQIEDLDPLGQLLLWTCLGVGGGGGCLAQACAGCGALFRHVSLIMGSLACPSRSSPTSPPGTLRCLAASSPSRSR